MLKASLLQYLVPTAGTRARRGGEGGGEAWKDRSPGVQHGAASCEVRNHVSCSKFQGPHRNGPRKYLQAILLPQVPPNFYCVNSFERTQDPIAVMPS